MQTHDPKSIKQCFQSRSLRLIVQQVRKILAIEKCLNQILPTEIISHYRIVNISQKTLILQLENSALATRVYYLIPHLLEQFTKQKLIGIQKVQCKVCPDFHRVKI
ncbi:DciA family protein [Coxiella endosymbiont of Amblyomma americanum]|uniref:DciA family protein n=1 Tax=Coxiella endosymbiont of Amblyomma americanum TaxID=325775 RepID=UPI00057CB153|nr:DciA family protein [Coxiella endosymbiont of Amblyomma americanum]AUJ58743.1 hypothetical protein B1F76_01435 [Coxiella-like endosymbiont of Amblyomma americanum]